MAKRARTTETERLREEDNFTTAIMVLASSQPFLHQRFEDVPQDAVEGLVENLVNLVNGEERMTPLIDFDDETKQRAALAVCRILQQNPLHLPEICESCGLPIRGPLARARQRCACYVKRKK